MFVGRSNFRVSLALLQGHNSSGVSSECCKYSTSSFHSTWLKLECFSSGSCITYSNLGVLFAESHGVTSYAAWW